MTKMIEKMHVRGNTICKMISGRKPKWIHKKNAVATSAAALLLLCHYILTMRLLHTREKQTSSAFLNAFISISFIGKPYYYFFKIWGRKVIIYANIIGYHLCLCQGYGSLFVLEKFTESVFP